MEDDNNNQEQEYIEDNQGDDEDEFMFIYRWVDTINLSRPKKNISRDFSDGEKVFKKLNFHCKKSEIDDVINCKPMAIQHFLKKIYFLVNKIKSDTNDNFGNNNLTEKEQYYRQQIAERDNQIEELRIRLEITEMNLKKSDDEKNFLNERLREYTEKVKQYGLF